MKLHAKKFGAAAGTAIVIIYSIIYGIMLLTTLLPLPIDIQGANFSPLVVVFGLLQAFIGGFIFFWLLAKLYNRFLDA